MGYFRDKKLCCLMQSVPTNATHDIPKGCRGCMYFQPEWKYRKCTLTKCCYEKCDCVFRKKPLERDKTSTVAKKV